MTVTRDEALAEAARLYVRAKIRIETERQVAAVRDASPEDVEE